MLPKIEAKIFVIIRVFIPWYCHWCSFVLPSCAISFIIHIRFIERNCTWMASKAAFILKLDFTTHFRLFSYLQLQLWDENLKSGGKKSRNWGKDKPHELHVKMWNVKCGFNLFSCETCGITYEHMDISTGNVTI